MRYNNTVMAKIPRGCIFIEAEKFPCNNNCIDLPNPHPRQKSKPKKCSGHIEIIFSERGKKKSSSKAATHIINSNGNFKYATISLYEEIGH